MYIFENYLQSKIYYFVNIYENCYNCLIKILDDNIKYYFSVAIWRKTKKMEEIKKIEKDKPDLSPWQILNMSVGFFGIQHGFEIQFARMSSIYEQLGADPSTIPMLWLAAPMTGLIIQPIIGYMSDRTWISPLRMRRRPYFMIGAILATIALFLMPNSSSLWMAAGLLWVLDASLNISMEPFRAFVADKTNEKQRSN